MILNGNTELCIVYGVLWIDTSIHLTLKFLLSLNIKTIYCNPEKLVGKCEKVGVSFQWPWQNFTKYDDTTVMRAQINALPVCQRHQGFKLSTGESCRAHALFCMHFWVASEKQPVQPSYKEKNIVRRQKVLWWYCRQFL